MRLLLEDRIITVMNHIDALMQNASFHPFHCASEHSSRILSGEEEGVFAWIAANYLLGLFNNNHQRTCKIEMETEPNPNRTEPMKGGFDFHL